VTGWGIMLSAARVCWHLKTRLESGPVTADLTPTVMHSLIIHREMTSNYVHSEKGKA